MDDCVPYVNVVAIDSVDYTLNGVAVSNRNKDRVRISVYPTVTQVIMMTWCSG